MYYQLQPPYFLLVVGLFVALTSGAALSGTLKLIVQKWQKDGAENSDTRISTTQLVLPFLGITGGISFFLGSGFQIFGFPPNISYGAGTVISLLTCWLVWAQLGSMLAYVEREGIKSLDLDFFR